MLDKIIGIDLHLETLKTLLSQTSQTFQFCEQFRWTGLPLLPFFCSIIYHKHNIILQSPGTCILLPGKLQRYSAWTILMDKLTKQEIFSRIIKIIVILIVRVVMIMVKRRT